MAGVILLFLCHLLLGYNEVQGYMTSTNDVDHLELESQLQLLNKPAIKTIQTDYGDMYDCVDFYKQPAFDHPLLKNHTYHFKMKPQFMNKVNDEISSEVMDFPNLRLKDGGCPMGTVPIKRTTREDLIREKRVAERLGVGGVHYAVVQTKYSDSNKFTGAEGWVAIYAPRTQGQQYSEARIKIQNGQSGNEFIQTGWRVDPTLYGNTLSHQFIQTNTNAAKCFDVRCGFVVVARDLSPGLAWPNISVRGGPILETKQSIKRDGDGNWWLSIGDSDNNHVGFWPHALFQELSDYGTFVDWGGEVFSPPGTPGPSMGSGGLPGDNPIYDAYVRTIKVYDINGNAVNPNTIEYQDYGQQYRVMDDDRHDGRFEHLVLYGGRGVGTMP